MRNKLGIIIILISVFGILYSIFHGYWLLLIISIVISILGMIIDLKILTNNDN